MKIEDSNTIVPKWAIKHTKRKLANGITISFTGKNPNHMSVIVTDPSADGHFNLTIRQNAYELHYTHEKTDQHISFFNLYSPVISQLLEHWWNKHPEWVKPFSPRYWKEEYKKYHVIDINSRDIPNGSWHDGTYYMEPKSVERIAIDKKSIIGMKVKVGLIFDRQGQSKGLLLALRKSKKLVRVKSQLFKKIIDTTVGIDNLISDTAKMRN